MKMLKMLKIVARKFGANPFERVFLQRIQKIYNR